MTEYPFQHKFFRWGMMAGLIGGIATFSPLTGFSLWVFFVVAGALWRTGEPPVLPFCLTFQWIFIVMGYFYNEVFRYFPGGQPGNLEGAVWLALLGLLAMTAGLRLALRILHRPLMRQRQRYALSRPYEIRKLFWCVIVFGSIYFLFEVNPRARFFNIAEIVSQVLVFLGFFTTILFATIIEEKRGYGYGIAAFLYTLLPNALSTHIALSGPFVVLLILFLGEWQRKSKFFSGGGIRWSTVLFALGTIVFLFCFAVVWQGGTKQAWRKAVTAGEVQGSPMEKMQAFQLTLDRSMRGRDWRASLESLAERLSGIYIFSHTLLRVPEVVPYTDGALTKEALTPIFQPRFLFPNKPFLKSSSRLVREYAGLEAAGEESGTSIGFSYMAQFYVDYGPIGMFVALFLWGLAVGLVYGWLSLFSPSRLFAWAAVIAVFPSLFSSFEGELAYLFGGLLLSFFILGLLLKTLGSFFHRVLLVRNLPPFVQQTRLRST